MAASTLETFAFQADPSALMALVTHALPSHREAFLGELLRNALDALDALDMAGTGGEELDAGGGKEHPGDKAAAEEARIAPAVYVRGDRAANTLTVEDTGVGMSRDELVANLGTVARSGTRAFLDLKHGGGDPGRGGQAPLGVGFYSAFLVADWVEVISRPAGGGAAHRWASSAAGGSPTFTVQPVADNDGGTGTRVVLHLKPDAREYADEYWLRAAVRRHCEFSARPVYVWTTVRMREEDAEPAADQVEKQQVGQVDQGAPRLRMRVARYEGYERINGRVGPLWRRQPDDVAPEEHEALCRSLTNDWEAPLAARHVATEAADDDDDVAAVGGGVRFRAVLYVPRNVSAAAAGNRGGGVRLYARGAPAPGAAAAAGPALLPDYLGFVHGVVDCDNLPRGAARGAAQGAIRRRLIRECLELFGELASSDADGYQVFYHKYGGHLKRGAREDYANRAELVALLRPDAEELMIDAWAPRMPAPPVMTGARHAHGGGGQRMHTKYGQHSQEQEPV
jgi:molecular chaperone HtpG